MAVLIDHPAWPAHGTQWAHLVSDTSLEELHAFAAALGLPRRSFDLDHYDVPAERHHDAVVAGAQLLDGRDLVRRLRASGLRVRAAERGTVRSERITHALRRRWDTLSPDVEVGDELLRRWSEPHRRYHDPVHLWWVLEHIDTLTATQLAHDALAGARAVAPARPLALAAWFHDAVYDGVAGTDEERSAALVGELGPAAGLAPTEVAEIQRLVMLTASHDPEPADAVGAILCDADLAILAGSPHRYGGYVAGVRAEYAHVPPADFAAGRARVLRRLLARPAIYRTRYGLVTWEAPARANLSRELATLEG